MLATEVEEVDAALANARKHVQDYQVQRRQCKHIINIACTDISYHLPSLFRHQVLIWHFQTLRQISQEILII
jgi:hypothetical protein